MRRIGLKNLLTVACFIRVLFCFDLFFTREKRGKGKGKTKLVLDLINGCTHLVRFLLPLPVLIFLRLSWYGRSLSDLSPPYKAYSLLLLLHLPPPPPSLFLSRFSFCKNNKQSIATGREEQEPPPSRPTLLSHRGLFGPRYVFVP